MDKSKDNIIPQKLGLNTLNHIDDRDFLLEMKNLTVLYDDARPVWVGPGYADTNIIEYKPYSDWANQHWAFYYGFIYKLLLENKNILDLGCGVGFNTINLSQLGKKCKIIGYDIDKEIIDFANIHNKNENITYINENIINNNLPTDIDYIFLVEILEHIKHALHYNLINKCLSSLKNNESRIFLCTPNENMFLDKDRGHIGILNSNFFEQFKNRYKQNIISIEYYDNKKLIGYDVP